MKKKNKIGIDYGGTKIEGILLNVNGQEIKRKRYSYKKNYISGIETVKKLVDEFDKISGHNCSVGIYNDFKFLSAKRKHIKTVKRVWLCNFCDKYYPDLRDIYDHTIYNHILISPNKIME